MVPHGGREELGPLLGAFHWQHAAEALETALEAARTPMLYPVYVTAFKCSPDSFALDAFRRILDAYGKPYLVLQLDDHDSSMGYETRIEAGVRAFRNHAERATMTAASPAGPVRPGRPCARRPGPARRSPAARCSSPTSTRSPDRWSPRTCGAKAWTRASSTRTRRPSGRRCGTTPGSASPSMPSCRPPWKPSGSRTSTRRAPLCGCRARSCRATSPFSRSRWSTCSKPSGEGWRRSACTSATSPSSRYPRARP